MALALTTNSLSHLKLLLFLMRWGGGTVSADSQSGSWNNSIPLNNQRCLSDLIHPHPTHTHPNTHIHAHTHAHTFKVVEIKANNEEVVEREAILLLSKCRLQLYCRLWIDSINETNKEESLIKIKARLQLCHHESACVITWYRTLDPRKNSCCKAEANGILLTERWHPKGCKLGQQPR